MGKKAKKAVGIALTAFMVGALYAVEPTWLGVVGVLLGCAAGAYLLLTLDGKLELVNAVRLTVTLGLLCFFYCLLSHIAPAIINVALFGLSWFCLLAGIPVSLFLGYFQWRKSSKWWILPLLLSVIFVLSPPIITPIMGDKINDWRFEMSLDDYNKITNEFQQGAINVGPELSTIDKKEIANLPSEVIAVRAARLQHGTIVVEFLWSAGGRIHKGYVFRDFKDADSTMEKENIVNVEKRFRMRHVVGNWYHFVDY
jgi:hypothetical protein